uniref:Putative endonuclease n=1 Tax=Pithovirus LCPAC101 TaxID=2506586 RepID=A0A481Z2K2_9VIRU|nr:MAG: putative endonuclease [Pithovirus LCPAC101]
MVNTFLVHDNFDKNAKMLDDKRLGKQRVEAYQILNICTSLRKLGLIYNNNIPSDPYKYYTWIRSIMTIFKKDNYNYLFLSDDTYHKINNKSIWKILITIQKINIHIPDGYYIHYMDHKYIKLKYIHNYEYYVTIKDARIDIVCPWNDINNDIYNNKIKNKSYYLTSMNAHGCTYTKFNKSNKSNNNIKNKKMKNIEYTVQSVLSGTDHIYFTGGFAYHPAVAMWLDHEDALKSYINSCICEWENRGFKNSMKKYIVKNKNIICPRWVYDVDMHTNHKSNLLTKEMERNEAPWYINMFPDVPTNIEYMWPYSHTYDINQKYN